MRVEFASPDDERSTPAATADWHGGEITVSSTDDDLRAALAHAFRRTPMVSDDSSSRRLGTSGAVMLQPGTLEWFRAVAAVRAPNETGLRARFVPGVPVGGFDPAAGYRRFEEQLELLDARSDR